MQIAREDFLRPLPELIAAEMTQLLWAGPGGIPIPQADLGVGLYAEVMDVFGQEPFY
jgi:hypothetical protein